MPLRSSGGNRYAVRVDNGLRDMLGDISIDRRASCISHMPEAAPMAKASSCCTVATEPSGNDEMVMGFVSPLCLPHMLCRCGWFPEDGMKRWDGITNLLPAGSWVSPVPAAVFAKRSYPGLVHRIPVVVISPDLPFPVSLISLSCLLLASQK